MKITYIFQNPTTFRRITFHPLQVISVLLFAGELMLCIKRSLVLTFSDFCLQHYQLCATRILFWNDHFRPRPSVDNLQIAPPNSMHQKVKGCVLSNQYSCYYDTFCLFHFMKDIRIISGLIGTIAFATSLRIPQFRNFCNIKKDFC